jgi:hypothetical protein
MPVTTRSQSKKIVHEFKNSTSVTQLFMCDKPKPMSMLEFTEVFITKLKHSEHLKNTYIDYKQKAALATNKYTENQYLKRYKHYYFKNLSHITDMFRYLDEHFDILVETPVSTQKLIDTIVTKCPDLEAGMEMYSPSVRTEEEEKIFNTLKTQLQKTKAMFEPYISSKKEPRYPKRSIKPVNYTGMDTIEPEDKYDGITNIWADQTIYWDSDYVDEDEDDDKDDDTKEYTNDDNEDKEEFEDYDSNGEDAYSVYSDQREDCFDKVEEEEDEEEDFIIEKVNDRHIRFVYK